ncbi:MAG: hypothetical protein WCI47_02835 [bacterium]
MSLIDIGLFLIVFFAIYLVVALIVSGIHLITKNKSTHYRVAAVVFAFLTAAMLMMLNLGRDVKMYYQIPTSQTEIQNR